METKCMHKAALMLRGVNCVFSIKHPVHCFISVVKCNGTYYPCAMKKWHHENGTK